MQKKIGNIISILGVCALIFGLTSCGVYSFTGASISPEVKTISVKYFPNNAPLVNSTLSQEFTQALKMKFTAQTSLILVDQSGDLNLEGEITGYSTRPIAIQGDETAALNRLSITVRVRFTNNFDETQNYETNFTQYQDYPSSSSLSSVEDGLILEINKDLVEDIFNKAVVNW
ncbi:MAG: hypothetical protein K8S00_05465 [Bacteroidales bacterium]|nr:hypothetical protein [Bacteroidales bacterium]